MKKIYWFFKIANLGLHVLCGLDLLRERSGRLHFGVNKGGSYQKSALLSLLPV